MFAEDLLQNFLMENRLGEQYPIKKGVTLPISYKMVVGRVWDGNLEEVVFTTEMIKKIGSPGVGETGVKISSEVYWCSWMGFNKISNSDGQVREFFKESRLEA